MNAKEISPISLISKIKDLKLLEYQIAETVPSSLVGKLDKDKVQFEFNIGIRMDIVKKTITITLNTQLFADEQKTIKLGYINSEGEFEILNLDEILSLFENKLPNAILANYTGVVIGTTRGFLIPVAKGTLMEGIFMPMINPLTLFSQPNESEVAKAKD